MKSDRKNIVLMIILVLLPLQRFFASPAIDTMRAVDMLLLFASGMAAGSLLTRIRLKADS